MKLCLNTDYFFKKENSCSHLTATEGLWLCEHDQSWREKAVACWEKKKKKCSSVITSWHGNSQSRNKVSSSPSLVLMLSCPRWDWQETTMWVSSVFTMSLLQFVSSSFTLITFSFYLLLDASSLSVGTKQTQRKICLLTRLSVDNKL